MKTAIKAWWKKLNPPPPPSPPQPIDQCHRCEGFGWWGDGYGQSVTICPVCKGTGKTPVVLP